MGMEPNTQPISRIVEGDYRITRSPSGITIEVLDYHADPLLLTDEVLEKLGKMSLASAKKKSTPCEGDYRITRLRDGIRIEVLGYHADPLLLTDEVLEKLGVTIALPPEH